MATATVNEVDYIDVVRKRLESMEQTARADLARQVGLSITTLYNVKDGRDAKYSTVMALYRATSNVQVPAKKTARKARAS